jgi:hypothetical protein
MKNKPEETFTLTYKGGRGKGFEETNMLIKATNKAEARSKFYKIVPNGIIKSITILNKVSGRVK